VSFIWNDEYDHAELDGFNIITDPVLDGTVASYDEHDNDMYSLDMALLVNDTERIELLDAKYDWENSIG